MGLGTVTDGQDPTELVPVIPAPAPPVGRAATTSASRRGGPHPDHSRSRPHGEPSFLIRAVWFIFIGWWLSAIAISVAYFLCAIIIGIPLAFMVQPLPWILTFRARTMLHGLERRTAPALDPRRLVPLGRMVARCALHDRRVRPLPDPHRPADRAVDVQPRRGGHDVAALLMAPGSAGAAAERLVVERLRAVLPPDVALLHDVRWVARDRGHVREGEADVVIGAIQIVEPGRSRSSSGEVRRLETGRWWVGGRELNLEPVEQAADSRWRALVRKRPSRRHGRQASTLSPARASPSPTSSSIL